MSKSETVLEFHMTKAGLSAIDLDFERSDLFGASDF